MQIRKSVADEQGTYIEGKVLQETKQKVGVELKENQDSNNGGTILQVPSLSTI